MFMFIEGGFNSVDNVHIDSQLLPGYSGRDLKWHPNPMPRKNG